ncbi:MAG TPA: M20/M25/M40 family metallo-hydrolase [Bdellovibrionota bacterium]|jgi:leucyl aminopeptidase
MKLSPFFLVTLFSLSAFAKTDPAKPVLASLNVLQAAGAKVVSSDAGLNLGYGLANPAQQEKISEIMHENGRCGGFESLSPDLKAGDVLASLKSLVEKDRAYAKKRKLLTLEKKPEIVAALKELDENNIRTTVEWLAAFPNRYNKDPRPNVHVDQFEGRLRNLMTGFRGSWKLEQIAHTSTQQKSLRLHIEGTTRPRQIVVIGGHLDSISRMGNAPGADDNASGSASILEALRVFLSKGPAERTIEFFWYAGEESGLLGSKEIAGKYKAETKNVVAVLQLDMTLFPGAGQGVIGSMEDFTSAWLRDYVVAVNDTYVGAQLITDTCGYGCSDHASWYRQGFPTVMPFEADFDRMNHNIHTAGDVIDTRMSFAHSLMFAKIALVMAMDLGNSTASQPY